MLAARNATGIRTFRQGGKPMAVVSHLDPNSDTVWMKPGVHTEHPIRNTSAERASPGRLLRASVEKEREARTLKCRP